MGTTYNKSPWIGVRINWPQATGPALIDKGAIGKDRVPVPHKMKDI